MSDRYDDYERSSQGRRGERNEERNRYDRGSFNREEAEHRARGNWDEDEGRFGSGDREQYYGGQRGEGYYGAPRGDYGGQRGDWGAQRGEYGGGQRDWGPQRGEFGGQRGGERNWESRGPNWQRIRTEFGRDRNTNEGPWGTGPQGFGQGYRSGGSFSGSFSGPGSYTGYGSYGSESYSGGAGSYGQQRGQFSGRGPKGYQRSDERIREDVCERLTHHSDIDASEIEVKVSNAEVTLSGTVDERHAKRMAEEIAENVSGVKDVHNQVRVREREMAGSHQTAKTEGGSKESTGSQRR